MLKLYNKNKARNPAQFQDYALLSPGRADRDRNKDLLNDNQFYCIARNFI